MKPTTISASALSVAELCLARYEAEYIHRGRGMANNAASLGSVCHNALENFVTVCILDKTMEATLSLLLDLFGIAFLDLFGYSADKKDPLYLTGIKMLEEWYQREFVESNYFTDHEVISCETKKSFQVPTSIGPLTLNYIMDRIDRVDKHTIRIVDYKSSAWDVKAEDLKDKWQPKIYALAIQIEYKDDPDLQRIWVDFDMLKHGGRRGIVFSREDNADTWRKLKAAAQRIIDTPAGSAPETLNAECRFCVRKLECKTLIKTINVGGLAGRSVQDLVDLRADLDYQKAGITSALNDVDNYIAEQARAEDMMEYSTKENRLYFGARGMRKVDPERVEKVIGDDLWCKYGSASISMSVVDDLLKGTELTLDQKKELKSLIRMEYGELKVKTAPVKH